MSDPTASGSQPPGWAPPPATPGWGGSPPGPAGWGPPASPGRPYGPQWGAPGHDPKRRFKVGALVWAAIGGAASVVTGVVVLGLVLGSVDVGSKDSSISATHPLATESAQPLRPGDCLSAAPVDAVVVDRHQLVPCLGFHRSEVIGRARFPDAREYPDSELGAFADAACAVAFHEYVGIPVADSEISGRSIVPNRTAWRAGDRAVWCLVDSSTYADGRSSARRARR